MKLIKPASVVLALSMSISNALSQELPRAGMWELTVTMQGLPMGGGTHINKVCLSAPQLTDAPEKTLMDAAAPRDKQQDGKAPKCELKDIKREVGGSTWMAACQGPRGPMQGTGKATLAGTAVELQQNFEISMFGKRTLQQSVRAVRHGEC